jgi:hypothetical protein
MKPIKHIEEYDKIDCSNLNTYFNNNIFKFLSEHVTILKKGEYTDEYEYVNCYYSIEPTDMVQFDNIKVIYDKLKYDLLNSIIEDKVEFIIEEIKISYDTWYQTIDLSLVVGKPTLKYMRKKIIYNIKNDMYSRNGQQD